MAGEVAALHVEAEPKLALALIHLLPMAAPAVPVPVLSLAILKRAMLVILPPILPATAPPAPLPPTLADRQDRMAPFNATVPVLPLRLRSVLPITAPPAPLSPTLADRGIQAQFSVVAPVLRQHRLTQVAHIL